MNASDKLRGTIVPMVTPLQPDGTLDEAALERAVERLAALGQGVFVLGTTGEAPSVPAAMRRRLVEIAVGIARRRVAVFAGIGDNCVADSVAAAADYLRLGIDAVVAHLPSYYLLDPREMQAYFELLARKIHGPLVVYNIPQATHMSVPVAVLRHLADIPNVIGLKDSENSAGRLEEVAACLGDRPGFSIFMGTAALAVAALRRGYDGLVPGTANLVPELWQELAAQAGAGSWEAAEDLQRRVNAIARTFQSNRSLGQSLATLKAAMEARGFCGPTVLPPLQTLDPSERALIHAAFRAEFDRGPAARAAAAP